MSGLIQIYPSSTNLRSSTLLPLSTKSPSLTGETSNPHRSRTLRSISFTPSTLSAVCWSGNQATDKEVSRSRIGQTHIVVLYQDGHGSHDCLQWKEQIAGFIGDFYGHLDCSVCRSPALVSSPNSSTITEHITGIVEWGAGGESDSG